MPQFLDESSLVWSASLLATAAVVVPYALHFRRRATQAAERHGEAVRLGIDRPATQFPYVDANLCIGCGACVRACPEGDVLGVVGGTAAVINGLRCVGHSRCEEVCPVGAIEVGLGDLKQRSDIPQLDEHFETNVPGVLVAGELTGIALIRNAVAQGRMALARVESRARGLARRDGLLDLAIIGAGPAGISAALAAEAGGISYRLLERESTLGGSLLHYPRRKMVLTQPVAIDPWGKLDRETYSKEDLLDIFGGIVRRYGLRAAFGENVEAVERRDEEFAVRSTNGTIRARNVLLTLGRRGTPRKLGVEGEELAKVTYRLQDADSYRGQRLLVVGGGDSAVEAAVGLARLPGNEVTLSYRRERLVRIKKKNQDAVDALIARGKVRPLFSSEVREITPSHVRLSVPGGDIELPNDYVFVLAGGVPPFAFLRGIGIRFGGDPTPDGPPGGAT